VTDTVQDHPVVDPDEFRRILGHFATGVTIVTAMVDDEPVGMAANAFSSVSLDPPLVLFCAAKSSSTWPKIHTTGSYAVNILGEHQAEVCRNFATAPSGERFRDVAFHTAATGSPILSDSVAFVDCRIDAEHDAGDHTIVVGRVVELGQFQEELPPLLFHRGVYPRLAT